MALLDSIYLERPRFSNKDLSRTRAMSCAPGPLYVAFCERAFNGDTWVIRTSNDVKTYPLKSPFFGTFRQQLCWFFVPDRLYTPELDVNNPEFDPDSVTLPTEDIKSSFIYNTGEEQAVQVRVGTFGALSYSGESLSTNNVIGQVKPSSLLNQLGFPAGFMRVHSPFRYNATPLYGYFDIFLNYFCNTQEAGYYQGIYSNMWAHDNPLTLHQSSIASNGAKWVTQDGISSIGNWTPFIPGLDDNGVVRIPKVKWAYFPLMPSAAAKNKESLSSIMQALKERSNSWDVLWSNMDQIEYDTRYVQATSAPDASSMICRLGGLVLRTHRPDLLNAWVSGTNYNEMVRRSRIITSGTELPSLSQSFTINQLRLGSHLLKYYERGLVAGGRYDDWLEAQFGIKTDNQLLIPELLGVHSSTIAFNDVVNTAAPSSADSNNSNFSGNTLGALAGRGFGSLKGKVRFTCKEYGFVMGIYSIVPNCTYSQGIKDWMFDHDFGDLYTPAMQTIGFQPLLTAYAYALPGYQISNSPVPGVPSPSGWSVYITENPGLILSPGPETSGSNAGYLKPSYNPDVNQTALSPSFYEDATSRYGDYLAYGYQPAWTPYSTAINEAIGAFDATAGDLSYWVPVRDYRKGNGVSIGDPTGTTSPATRFSEGTFTSYVRPDQFLFPFDNQDIDAENFLVHFGFDVFCRRAMSKSVMPTLC